MRRRRARPRAGQPGNSFTRWNPPTAPAEQEGPPIPKHIEEERMAAFYDHPAFKDIDMLPEDIIERDRKLRDA